MEKLDLTIGVGTHFLKTAGETFDAYRAFTGHTPTSTL